MSDIVYIGMDLGTSRTSITTSTGVRTTVWSYVGYAQDHVSRKHLGGRDKVFGEEAVQNRMAVDLVRPLDKGVIQDDEKSRHAVRDLIEFVIDQAEIPTGSTIYGVIGAPAEASVDSKAHILAAASEFMDSIVVCSEPTDSISSPIPWSSISVLAPSICAESMPRCRRLRINELTTSVETPSTPD